MTTKMYRQGDVLVVETKERPASAKPVPRDAGRVILAYGEVTGHAHALTDKRATLYRDDGAGSGGRTFLSIAPGDPAELQHEEHSTIPLPGGKDYEVIIQREYSPAEIRNVAD